MRRLRFRLKWHYLHGGRNWLQGYKWSAVQRHSCCDHTTPRHYPSCAKADRKGPSPADRRFVPPLGWPLGFRAVTVTPADRHPLIVLNRYPRQVIGFAVRLPDESDGRHKALSVLWSKPARWWA